MPGNWFDADDLLEAYGKLPLPGMTTIAERAFAHAYAARCFQGRGEILDLGCWLGSLTVPLAKGLKDNPHPEAANKRIHSYDLFIWQQWMEDLAPAMNKTLTGRFKVGQSFLPEFENVVSPWNDRIQVYEGDVLQKGWNGAPVEFMYVDAMKDWDLTCGIHNLFMRHLVPGGYVAHQDFAFHSVPWLHLYAYRLREWLEPVHHVPNAFTVLFQLSRNLPDELREIDWNYSNFSVYEVDSAFRWAASIVGAEQKLDIAVSQAYCCFWRGDTQDARQMLDQIRIEAQRFRPGLSDALERLEKMLGGVDELKGRAKNQR